MHPPFTKGERGGFQELSRPATTGGRLDSGAGSRKRGPALCLYGVRLERGSATVTDLRRAAFDPELLHVVPHQAGGGLRGLAALDGPVAGRPPPDRPDDPEDATGVLQLRPTPARGPVPGRGRRAGQELPVLLATLEHLSLWDEPRPPPATPAARHAPTDSSTCPGWIDHHREAARRWSAAQQGTSRFPWLPGLCSG